MQALIAAAEASADAAGAVIRPLFRQGVAADVKSDASPVTIADRNAEQAMRALLAERFPEHGILGEEFGHDRPGGTLRTIRLLQIHQAGIENLPGARAFAPRANPQATHSEYDGYEP